MRERVEALVGRRARAMWVMTFHSACARMLRAEGERLGYTRGFTIYDESDSLRLVKQCLDEGGEGCSVEDVEMPEFRRGRCHGGDVVGFATASGVIPARERHAPAIVGINARRGASYVGCAAYYEHGA
jgi:hypothetical protein